ncbi:hypothetical protein EV174_006319, partial [Coemansia sp. RSA 2320]
MYRPMAQTLCGAGLFVVLPRVGSTPRSALEDLHVAVAWVAGNAANFGGDPRRVHLMGCGAGAHVCAMYGLAPAVRAWYGAARAAGGGGGSAARLLGDGDADDELRLGMRGLRAARGVAGLVLVSGVYDLVAQRRYEAARCIEHMTAAARAFGGSAARELAWSPALVVRALRRRSAALPASLFAPSVLLIHGRLDSTFELAQSQRMFRELCGVGVAGVAMKIYANLRR